MRENAHSAVIVRALAARRPGGALAHLAFARKLFVAGNMRQAGAVIGQH